MEDLDIDERIILE